MNKIKLLHDVFKTMKEKEAFKGNLNLEVFKDKENVFLMKNEYETDTVSGKTLAKIHTEIGTGENRAKHESSTEFNSKTFKHHGHHDHHGRLCQPGMNTHFHHHNHHPHFEGGIKEKLSRITMLFNILNNIQAEEKEEGTVLFLDLKETFKDAKSMVPHHHDGLKEDREGNPFSEMHKHHHEFIKGIFDMDHEEGKLVVSINKNNEVEKVEIVISGKKADNTGNLHEQSLAGKLEIK